MQQVLLHMSCINCKFAISPHGPRQTLTRLDELQGLGEGIGSDGG